MQAHNQPLGTHANWTLQSGYALDLFERGTLRPDSVFFSSTSVLFNNAELNLYFASLARSAKEVVLNEPWWSDTNTLNPFRNPLPHEIPPEEPLCAGRHSNYHHNYVSKLTERGYAIETYRLLPHVQFRCLQIAATTSRESR